MLERLRLCVEQDYVGDGDFSRVTLPEAGDLPAAGEVFLEASFSLRTLARAAASAILSFLDRG